MTCDRGRGPRREGGSLRMAEEERAAAAEGETPQDATEASLRTLGYKPA